MPNPNSLYKLIHSSPEIKTVGDLVNDKNSVAYSYLSDPEAFLAIRGDDGLTNRERIEATFKRPEEKKFIGAKATRLPLPTNMLLYIESEKINSMSTITEGIEVVSTDEVAFKAKALADLEADPGYFQVNKPLKGMASNGSFKSVFPEVTVWIWIRSFSPKSDEDKELTGQWFDISPFIINCVTNMSKNGGNFQITLPPIMCELNDERQWVINKLSFDRYVTDKDTSLQSEGYVAQSNLFSVQDDELIRNQYLFHNLIQPNDLIYIRYETLDMERGTRYNESQNYQVNKNNIAGHIYDMIGLVDTNIQTTTAETNGVVINLSGRDLSKLFIEDGTYFYALENSQGMIKFAGQSESKNQLINRIYGDGALNFLSLYLHQPISFILKFIIQQLANIEVVPDHVFASYGDRINKRFKVYEQASKSNQEFKTKPVLENAAGIWQIVKLVIDESVSDRRIQDSSFSTANGSLLNFIRTACQEPLVEFWMDTYGDLYHLIVRKPPHDQKALISLLEGKVNTEDGKPTTPSAVVDIEQDDVLQETLAFDDQQVYSWYHFFPKNNFFGDANSYSLSYIGAVHFPEYAKIYGSKPFQQPHPYIPYVPLNNSRKGIALYEEQAIQDLKYVIETSQYLPFTRKGRLMLNGDRRIKVGNIIRYKSTGEIFFVDAVQQSYQITEDGVRRITVVSVSRGMIEQLIYGTFFTSESGERRYVSYFNIINTDLTIQFKDVAKKIVKTRKRLATVTQGEAVTSGDALADQGGLFFVTGTGNTGLHLLEKYNDRPENKQKFIAFINGINSLGWTVWITSTQRSFAEQWNLKYGDGGDLGNAEPGSSSHENFAAIDINVTNPQTGQSLRKRSPQADWEASGIPTLAKSLGLRWAGGNGSFGAYVDRCHFQIADNSNLADGNPALDQTEEYTETVIEKELDRDRVFSNFKVNQYTFNFFLKKLQFDLSYRKVTSREWQFQHDEKGTPLPVVITTQSRR